MIELLQFNKFREKKSVTLKNGLYFKLYLHTDFDVSTDIN